MEVCNLLITNNFKLIDINHERITLLFKNNQQCLKIKMQTL